MRCGVFAVTGVLALAGTLAGAACARRGPYTASATCDGKPLSVQTVDVKAPQAVLDAVGQWGDRTWLFTNSAAPTTEISGVQWNDVAFSGLDFMVDGKAEQLAKAMGLDSKGQLHVVMTGSPVFEDTADRPRPKLFVAFCSEASNVGLKGAAKMNLVSQ